MKLGLENKVVLITGGTGGIGAQVVADYLAEGAIVACLVRSASKMEDLKTLGRSRIFLPKNFIHFPAIF